MSNSLSKSTKSELLEDSSMGLELHIKYLYLFFKRQCDRHSYDTWYIRTRPHVNVIHAWSGIYLLLGVFRTIIAEYLFRFLWIYPEVNQL